MPSVLDQQAAKLEEFDARLARSKQLRKEAISQRTSLITVSAANGDTGAITSRISAIEAELNFCIQGGNGLASMVQLLSEGLGV
jgi:hypothetical protein